MGNVSAETRHASPDYNSDALWKYPDSKGAQTKKYDSQKTSNRVEKVPIKCDEPSHPHPTAMQLSRLKEMGRFKLKNLTQQHIGTLHTLQRKLNECEKLDSRLTKKDGRRAAFRFKVSELTQRFNEEKAIVQFYRRVHSN
ncbi:hypothetical protein [Parashewanella tropica]|uniref:hypothetical protein n=1 Tax=Parashewanella tropica TaxID=2547970 RepID=UPI001059E5A6|nr:hypothetical protein [Parashewanella tropica]